jgi:hypothetical protein
MKKSTLLKVIKAHDKIVMGETELDTIKFGFIANIITSIGGICNLYFQNNLPKENVLDIMEVFY